MVRFSTLPTKAGIKLIKQRSFLVPMLGGRRINVYNEYGTVFLNDIDNPVRVVRPDIYASNGIIHFIDKPLRTMAQLNQFKEMERITNDRKARR